jgi:uroporphyrin-III C-methyltransferase
MTVHLVGAGPGSADLLTVRAAQLLTRADIVIHDRLIDPEVLALIAPWAELINVGKTPSSKINNQDHINALLVDAGHRAKTVVRLKGGDPFVFGRGGEEARALQAAGIKVTEVPGITSAIAGPAAAGIPVTQRGYSSGFTVITGHQDPTTGQPINWKAAAQLGTTLIILMGASRTVELSKQLQDGGLAANTPVAAIRSATTKQQEIRRTTLAKLPTLSVKAPSVLVIGAVAALDVTDASLHELTHHYTPTGA